MLFQIINTLLPVFATILVGYVLTRRGMMSTQFLEDLNHFVFWVALPAFIVSSLGTAGGIPAKALLLIGVFHGATFIVLGTAAIVLVLMRFERWRMGTFLQAVLRGNIAFIAIPILTYALRNHPQEEVSSILGQAIFLFAPTMVIYNVVSVLMLSYSSGGTGTAIENPILDQLKKIAKNPLLVASGIGIALALLPWKLPGSVMDTMGYLGRIAGPAALLCVGGAMVRTPITDHFKTALLAGIFKVGCLPLVTYFIASFFKLQRTDLLILLVFSASPTAVASYIMAKSMQGDAGLASSAIVLSTILSVASLSVIIAFFV